MSCSADAPLGISRRDVLKLAASLGFLVAPGYAGSPRQIRPVDESNRDESLHLFLGRMRSYVGARDDSALQQLIAADFKVEFDAGRGPTAFRQYWRPEQKSSMVWTILDRLLTLGGTFYSDTLFALPYVYTLFPPDLDLLGNVVAVKQFANVYDRPVENAAKEIALNYAILPLVEPVKPPVVLRPELFIAVEHPEVGRCFVRGSDVCSPAGHRAFFEKRDGKWTWLSLVAGTLAEPPDLIRLESRQA